MKKLIKLFNQLPWLLVIMGSLTLGLAPFSPQPHLLEKLQLLIAGNLYRPIDIFDLFMHGIFPLLFVLKSLAFITTLKNETSD